MTDFLSLLYTLISPTIKITALTAVETGGLNTIEPLVVSAKTDLPCLDVAGQGR